MKILNSMVKRSKILLTNQSTDCRLHYVILEGKYALFMIFGILNTII